METLAFSICIREGTDNWTQRLTLPGGVIVTGTKNTGHHFKISTWVTRNTPRGLGIGGVMRKSAGEGGKAVSVDH